MIETKSIIDEFANFDTLIEELSNNLPDVIFLPLYDQQAGEVYTELSKRDIKKLYHGVILLFFAKMNEKQEELLCTNQKLIEKNKEIQHKNEEIQHKNDELKRLSTLKDKFIQEHIGQDAPLFIRIQSQLSKLTYIQSFSNTFQLNFDSGKSLKIWKDIL